MIFGWLDAWIFFGAALAAVLAGGQLVRRTPGANNRLLAALLLSVAVWQGVGSLYSYLAAARSFALVNSLHLVAVAAYLCTGPLLYLYFSRALHSVVEWRRIHFFTFRAGHSRNGGLRNLDRAETRSPLDRKLSL